MNLRKIIFWVHLVIGVGFGLIIIMMSLTGVLLTYEMQLNQWALRHYRAPSLDADPLAISALMARV